MKHRLPFKYRCYNRKMESKENITLDTSHTVLEPYNPEWVIKYEQEVAKLQEIFGEKLTQIEHIGSTSIPGLSAKPIIDIAVEIESHAEADTFIDSLKKIGYTHDLSGSSSERHFFRKGTPTEYHLSICYKSRGSFLKRQLAFRDYLKTHPEAKDKYAQIKNELLKQDPTGKNTYISNKSEFVERILKEVK